MAWKMHDDREREQFTDKQHQTLSLLVRHMTSKEISRKLGISRHTVDQRIDAAKRKLGVATRGELAQAYLRLRQVSEQMTYEESLIVIPGKNPEQLTSDEPGDGSMLVDPDWLEEATLDERHRPYLVGPELLNGDSATIYRIAAIIGIAVLLIVAVLGGITMFVEISRILAQ
jgi:DNA-binding CsgD family transcriptional regulator